MIFVLKNKNNRLKYKDLLDVFYDYNIYDKNINHISYIKYVNN